MDEIDLTFDPSGFMKGLENISSGIGEMTNQLVKFGSTANKKVQQVQFSAFSLVKALAPIAIAAKGLQGAFREIPEIGRTFSIAGNIMMRNFMWPIRKMLLPLLQRILDWVRDNRAMFVRWGGVVANIFRTIFSIVKGVFGLLKSLWERISSGIERVFGKTINSMTELVNLALFKLSAIAEFILLALQPVFDFIADLFTSALKNVKAFIGGFINGLGDLSPELEGMFKSLSRIGQAIDRITGKTGSLTKIFRFFGNTIGFVAGIITRTLGVALDFAATKIENLQLQLEGFQAWRAGDVGKQKEILNRQNKLNENFNKRFLETIDRQVDTFKKSRQDMGAFAGAFDPTTQVRMQLEKTTKETTKEISSQKKTIEKLTGVPNALKPMIDNKSVTNENKKTNTQNIDNIKNFTKNSVSNNSVTRNQIKNVNNNQKKTVSRQDINNNFTINVSGGAAQQTADQTAKAVRDILLESKFKTGGR